MIRAIAIDAAFANMGLARVLVHPGAAIECQDLRLISTTKESNKKQVRVSSDDLRRVMELGSALDRFIWDAQLAFVEVPSGAMDARAARGLGMATGVLAVLGVRNVPIIEVSPMEVKIAVSGNRKTKASKADIIEWAAARWPEAPWLRAARDGSVTTKTKAVRAAGGKGKTVSWRRGDLLNDNEHLADALAIATAGINTPAFQQLMALSNHATTSTPDRRPSSGRIALL